VPEYHRTGGTGTNECNNGTTTNTLTSAIGAISTAMQAQNWLLVTAIQHSRKLTYKWNWELGH
jgi:hypothetical protein